MSPQTLINNAMLAYAPLMAVVVAPGGDPAVDARIYPDFLSQEIERPGVVNVREDTEYINTIHTGAAVASRVTMESYCMDASRPGAEYLADLVEAALVAGEFRIVGRRSEFNDETTTFAAIVVSEVWP